MIGLFLLLPSESPNVNLAFPPPNSFSIFLFIQGATTVCTSTATNTAIAKLTVMPT